MAFYLVPPYGGLLVEVAVVRVKQFFTVGLGVSIF